MSETVLFLGAGATASVRNLVTDDILPELLREKSNLESQDSSGRVASLVQFLAQEFHVSPGDSKQHFPGLPLLMSLIDTAIGRREDFYGAWDLDTLVKLREAIEFGIYDLLEDKLSKAPTNNHFEMLRKLFPNSSQPCVISTNYDLLADAALMNLGKLSPAGPRLPDYRCGIANIAHIGPEDRFGTLLKLHGSLNWLLCKNCQRLELGESESVSFASVLQKAVGLNRTVGPELKSSFLSDGSPCPICGFKLRPLLVAPSHLKDYRNPHLSQVWYEAQQVLRCAKRIIFVGYSLPDDDVEVVYLLKRSLARRDGIPVQVTVVQYHPDNFAVSANDHPVGRRYRTLFGNIQWHAGGLNSWLSTVPEPVSLP
jgi:hypothetical protein